MFFLAQKIKVGEDAKGTGRIWVLLAGRRLQKDMLTSRRALAFLPLRFKKNGSRVKRAERDDF